MADTDTTTAIEALTAQIAELQRQMAELRASTTHTLNTHVTESAENPHSASSPDGSNAHRSDHHALLPDNTADSVTPAGTTPAAVPAVIDVQAVTVVEDEFVLPKRRKGERLTPAELGYVLALHKQGKPQTEIAKRVNASQATISRILADLQPTEQLAKAKLKAGAVKLAERVVEAANVEESLEVLDRLDVLEKKRNEADDGRVQVLVGIQIPNMPDLTPKK